MAEAFEVLLPALLVVGLLIFLLTLLPRERNWTRTTVLAFGLLLHLRYIHWRLPETLPPFQLHIDALWPYLFLLLELISFLAAMLSAFFLTRTVDRGAEADRNEARVRKLGHKAPSVDVFITTYNEGLEVVERTIIGAQAMEYPNFQVWVLDDGSRDWLRVFCLHRGVRYLERSDNAHAKAGNINNAIEVSASETNADLIMILDADFVPRRDFLYRTVGFFQDPEIGLVQTPQSFFNPDPVQANLITHETWVDEQRFFFDIVQPSLDSRDVAFCCGTSSIVRRDLVEAMGGFPTESVTEDMLLTYRLMKHGYVSRYLNERLSVGLAPEGLSEYVTQRSRWCLGTMQMAHLRDSPLWHGQFTWIQRLAFLNSSLYYLGAFPFLLASFVAPLLYLFLGVPTFIEDIDVRDIALFLGPFYVASLMINYWISDGRLFPLLTEVSHALASFNIVGALTRGILNPFGHRFQVTPKGGSRNAVVVQWQLLWKFMLLLGLTLLGILLSQLPAVAPAGHAAHATVIHYWAFLNVVLLLLSALICIDLPRYRSQERFVTGEMADIRVGKQASDCTLWDVSLSGARIDALGFTVNSGQAIELDIGEVGWIRATVVRMRTETSCAVTFSLSDKQRDHLIARLYTRGYRNRIGERAQPFSLMKSLLARLSGF